MGNDLINEKGDTIDCHHHFFAQEGDENNRVTGIDWTKEIKMGKG